MAPHRQSSGPGGERWGQGVPPLQGELGLARGRQPALRPKKNLMEEPAGDVPEEAFQAPGRWRRDPGECSPSNPKAFQE